MPADFDAGSIEGTLELNTKPFYAGLRRARTSAEKFEQGDDIEPEVGLDKSEFDTELAAAQTELGGLDRQTAEPRVRLAGMLATITGIRLIRRHLRKLATTSVKVAGVAALTAALLGVVAAAGPATVALGVFGLAGAVAFGGIVAAIIPFAVAMTGAVGKIIEANDAGKTLAGWAGRAQKSFNSMKDTWAEVQKAVAPDLFKVLVKSFKLLESIMPALVPIIKTVAGGFSDMLDMIAALTKTAGFEQFMKTLNDFIGGFLSGAGKGFVLLLQGYMDLFIALQPVMSMLGGGILNMIEAFAQWADGLLGNEDALSGFQRSLSGLGDLVVSVWDAIKSVVTGLAPLARPGLRLLTAIFDLIASIDFRPVGVALAYVADGLAAILENKGVAKMLLGIAAAAALFFGGPIIAIAGLVGAIALLTPYIEKLGIDWGRVRSVVGGVIDSIQKHLGPAFSQLREVVVNEVLPVLADLFNWFTTKIIPIVADAVAPVLKELARVFSEDLVPGVIEVWRAIKPLIPTFKKVAEWLVRVGTATGEKLLPPLIKFVGWVTGSLLGSIADWIRIWTALGRKLGQAGVWISNLAEDFRRGIDRMKAKFDEWRHKVEVVIRIIKSKFDDLVGDARALAGRITSATSSMWRGVPLPSWSGIKAAFSELLWDIAGWGSQIGRAAANMWNSIPRPPGWLSGGGGALLGLGRIGLAQGGVTRGPTNALIGDNPGGREAVVPLDQYDLPRKGDLEQIAGRSAQAEREMIGWLAAIAQALRSDGDDDALAEAIGRALSKYSEATMRQMVQLARSA